MNFMAVLDELRKAVESDGRSHAAIAAAAHIHAKTFSAFMHRRRGLSIETIEHLAEALHYDLNLSKKTAKKTR